MTNQLVNPSETNLVRLFSDKKKIPQGSWSIWSIGAGAGLFGGMLLLFGNCFLDIFQYFSGEKTIGVWLFLAVLPLLFLGAHCFDKAEEMEMLKRIEYCKKHGMNVKACRNQKIKTFSL